MSNKKIKDFDAIIKKQQGEIDMLKKRTRRHKWLILSMLFDK